MKLRDLALAVSVLLAGQDLVDFGFECFDPPLPDSPFRTRSPASYRLPSPAARDAAFAAWRDRSRR